MINNFKDFEMLEEAYEHVLNEGIWDRVKANVAGAVAGTKAKFNNTVNNVKTGTKNIAANASNLVNNVGNAIRGAAGNNNALNQVKQNNINTQNQINQNNQNNIQQDVNNVQLNAKQDSLLKSYSTKIEQSMNQLNQIINNFNNDIQKMQLVNTPIITNLKAAFVQSLQNTILSIDNSFTTTQNQQSQEAEERFWKQFK